MAWFARFRKTFQKDALEKELDDELRAHLDMRATDNVRSGMTPEEARFDAQKRFGNVTRLKESARDEDALPWLDNLITDLRFGARMLRKNPAFTVIAILTLALGIGVNTAFFTVVNGVLLNPLPFPHPEELVSLGESKPNFDNGSISYPNFVDWRKDNQAFTSMAVSRPFSFTLTGLGDAEELDARFLSSDYFLVLGVNPILGRAFVEGEDKIGAAPIALISTGLWRRKFAASTEVVGKTLTLDGRTYTIVGVFPERMDLFRSSKPIEVFVPIGQWNNPLLPNRDAGLGIRGVARLKPGVTIEQARSDMQRVSSSLEATYPGTNKGIGATLTAYRRALVGNIQLILLVLFGSVGFVLLIACFNVASLMLARSTARMREFAVRTALGAGRGRLIRQLLTESVLLSSIGGLLGLLLAYWATNVAVRILPAEIPRTAEIQIDSHVLIFAVVISLVAGIIFGLAPALKSSEVLLSDSLKEAGRGSSGKRHRAQSVFVVLEMAMALVLLIGAGLMARTLSSLWSIEPGFDPRNVLTFTMSLPPSMHDASPAAVRAGYREIHRTFASVNGIEGVSAAWGAVPLGWDDEQLFWFDNQPKPANENDMYWALSYVVDADYLKTMRISLIRGRFLSDSDNENSQRVAVIDEVLAKKYFPNENPIGRHITFQHNDGPSEIVGIVSHVKQWGLDSDDVQPLRSQVYVPFMQLPDAAMRLAASGTAMLVRSDGSNPKVFDTLRAASRQMSGEQVLYAAQTMEEIISESLSSRRFAMILLGIFATLALILASIGIYGVISYLVGQRRHEIGVRVALGARRTDVLRLVLSQGARLATFGIVIGLACSFGLARLMAKMLYGVSAADPLTFTAVAVVLGVVALGACYIPARRAMQVDPVIALKYE
jgi:predicted permease